MSNKWDMDEAYPPVLWTDYPPLVRKLTAEWLRCADLRCDDEYALNELAAEVGEMVMRVLKNRGMTCMLRVDCKHIKKEEE